MATVGNGNFHPKMKKEEAKGILLDNGFTKNELKNLNGRQLIHIVSQLKIMSSMVKINDKLLTKFKKLYLN